MTSEQIKQDQAVTECALQPGIPWNEDGPDTVYIDLSRDLVVKFKETTRHLFTVMQKINDSKTAKTKKQVFLAIVIGLATFILFISKCDLGG